MLVIGSDHGGFLLKQEIKKHLEEKGVDFVDVGCYDENSVDYPDVAKAAPTASAQNTPVCITTPTSCALAEGLSAQDLPA